jgi:O-methyltransferase
MLLRMLKSLQRSAATDETPREYLEKLNAAHAAAPLDSHLDIVYGSLRIGEVDLLTLVRRCVRDSGVTVPAGKLFHRPLASYFLARYFLHSLDVIGERAECGVFAGTSSLLLCHAARTRDPSYAGAGFHLVDSFQGLAEPTQEDRFDTRSGKNVTMGKGELAATLDQARETFRDFPAVSYHRGWIPQVFDGLPDAAWSFVHLDVDHADPTYASLAYFYPRLSPGGVIVCDDYGAATFPGARRAWDRFCDGHDVPYIVLDTGQSVILKG